MLGKVILAWVGIAAGTIGLTYGASAIINKAWSNTEKKRKRNLQREFKDAIMFGPDAEIVEAKYKVVAEY